MKWLNVYRMRLMLCGVVTVVMLSVVNARGAYFQDNFDRPDGEVGNGWETWTEEDVEIKIVDNEVLIAGQQNHDWWRSGIYRLVDGQSRFSFDFKADDQFNVHIELNDGIYIDNAVFPNNLIEVYAWPGGPFSYSFRTRGLGWSGWNKINGSNMIAGEYNNLTVEQDGTEFTLTLNGQVVGTFIYEPIFRIGGVFISADAAAGTVGSLHIDNVVIGQPPIITNFDFNGDGTVDVNDVVTLTDYWGQDYSVCDVSPMPSGDGIVDTQDLLALANYLEQETALIAHWAFDETEGMYAADSVGKNNAIVMGGATWQPDGGQINGALELDGVSGYVIASPYLNPADGPFSIFAWIKGGAPGQVIMSQQATANWLSTDAEGNLMTGLKSSEPLAEPMLSEELITDGQWHRIGFIWDGSHRSLCVDGVVVANDMQPGLDGSQNSLYIGVDKNYTAGTFFSGLIDDIRIYNRAVSP
jgi:hypothetical protein